MSYTSSGVLSLSGQPEEETRPPSPQGSLMDFMSILQLAGPGASSPPGGTGPAGGSPSHWEEVARQMAQRKYGWTGADLNALDQIATAESGWNPKAVNPSSGAAGIPQMLPSAHPDVNVQQFLNNPMQQIRWMLRYIQGKYGSPSHALQVRQTQGWY